MEPLRNFCSWVSEFHGAERVARPHIGEFCGTVGEKLAILVSLVEPKSVSFMEPKGIEAPDRPPQSALISDIW